MSERTLDGLLTLNDVAGDAPIGDPDEEGLAELRELGRNLTNYLFQSLRILSIHDRENAAVDEPLNRLSATLGRLFQQTQTVHFITVEGQVYLNDLRIKMEASAYGNVTYLLGQLGRHGIGGITFISALPTRDLKNLILLLLETKPPKDEDTDPLEHIRVALDQADIPDVEFDQPYYFKSGEDNYAAGTVEEGAQEQAALSYAKGVLAVKDYFRAVEAAEAANPLRIRKIVHDLVDVAEDEPDDFLKLHVIHGIEDPYYNHCVNVATLAVALGRVLGLTRVELADLGAAAMFHDLGYSAIERQETEEQREFSSQDRMRLHPVAGFKSLLRQGEYGPGLLRRLLVTLEHHMHYSRPGGYPNLGQKSLSVFARIVQVADHYDALVTPHGDEPGLLPVKALERIVSASGSAFDPVVVKAMVQVVGRYPYGSLVRLSTGEVGVVTSGGREGDAFLRPIVMIVRAGDGSEVKPHAVDLAVPGILRRRVEQALDPHDSDLTPHAVLFDRLDDGSEDAELPDADSTENHPDPEAWNKAVWNEEDAETILAGPQGGGIPVVEDEEPADEPREEEAVEEEAVEEEAAADERAEEELPEEGALDTDPFAPAPQLFHPEAETPRRVDPTLSSFFPPVEEMLEGPEVPVRELEPPGPQPADDGPKSLDDVLAWLDTELDGAAGEEAPAVAEELPPPVEEFPLPDDDDDFGPPTMEVEAELPPAERALTPLSLSGEFDDLPPLLTEDGEEPEGEVLDDLPPLLPHDDGLPAAADTLSSDEQAWLAGAESAPVERPSPPPPTVAPEPEPEPPAREPLSKAELNKMIQKAFARGGEDAVLRLMKQLEAEGRA